MTTAALPAHDERRLTWAAFAFPLAMAVALSPWNDYFLGNALYYAVPSLVIVGLGWRLSRSGALALGCALALALYLGLYKAWVLWLPPDGLVWLGYFFSLPGAALGAVVAALLARRQGARGVFRLIALGAIATSVGAAVNQVALCSTLMHCPL